MKTITRRLHDGDDLLGAIESLAAEYEVQAGVILSAVGSLTQAKLRVPVLNDEVRYIELQDLEIDSVQGTVSVRGVHLHMSVSGIDGVVKGGHLKQGCIIRTTCELVIGILDDVTFDRQLDESTGFDELVIQ